MEGSIGVLASSLEEDPFEGDPLKTIVSSRKGYIEKKTDFYTSNLIPGNHYRLLIRSVNDLNRLISLFSLA